ncbi:hypothetical protein PF003_g17540 [Phytophthora fragariae]|nr:hypothetical protein PF003_g17540 [Phytophthora fragariae]
MVKMQRFLVSVAIAAVVMASARAQDAGSSLDESESGDGSAFLGGSFVDDAPSIGSDSAAGDATNEPLTPAPSPTSPPAVQPVVDGVTMFGQCGGVFYSGSTTCADPDAYCKELSIYNLLPQASQVDRHTRTLRAAKRHAAAPRSRPSTSHFASRSAVHAPEISMLKLRVVLSFAVAVLVTLTTLGNAAAQTLDPPSQADEPSYSGSGDTYDAGGAGEPVVEEPPPEYDNTPSPTKATPTKTSGTSGVETVPRWGPCDENVKCVKHTYCKLLSSGMSICYPA